MKRFFQPDSMLTAEWAAGVAAFAVTFLSVVWLVWWTGGDLFFTVFAVELALPLLIAGFAAWSHGWRRRRWARYVLWVAAAVALLEAPSMLWMFPFALALALTVVAALASLRSLTPGAARADL